MPYTSIREAAEEIHSGIITPAELVLETLERVDELDGEIHAYISVIRNQILYRDRNAMQLAAINAVTHFAFSPLSVRQRLLAHDGNIRVNLPIQLVDAFKRLQH